MSALNLLVPVHLEAFVVNDDKKMLKDVSFSLENLTKSSYRKFGGLGFYSEKGVEHGVDSKVLAKGIHLHWTLPDAFRKGKYTDDGSLIFPAAPNRWLIVRADSNQQIKTWVLESDCINKNDKNAKPNWIQENNNERKITPISIGNKIAIKDLKKDKMGDVRLTIMAPGNPDFAASYNQCRNVFGLYDDMADINPVSPYNNIGFTYQVFGWFTDSAENPLIALREAGNTTREKFTATMAKLGWILPDAAGLADGDLPDNVICHAMLASVLWKEGELGKLPANVSIGIGNSSAEALASLLKNNTRSTQQAVPDMLLGAFQYKALADHGMEGNGFNLLAKKMHARSFLPVDGGTHWVIEAKPQNNGPDDKKDQEVNIEPFPPDISNALINLNNLQQDYDSRFNQLKSLQSELYALKYRKAFISTRDFRESASIKKAADEKLTSLIASTVKQIESLKPVLYELKHEIGQNNEKKKEYAGKIPAVRKALQDLLDKDLPELLTKEVPAAKFYEPVDPAVVITGLNPPLKYTNKAGAVNCRIKTQVCDKISFFGKKAAKAVDITEKATVNLINEMVGYGISEDIGRLIYESFLLSPVTSNFVAKALGEIDNAVQVKELIANHNKHPECFIRDDKNNAYLPADFASAAWKQPWNPLYLEWGVTWRSSYRTGSPNMLKGWKLGDAQKPVDFKFNLKAAENDIGVQYYGRTLLSSQLATKVDEINNKLESVMGNRLFNDLVPMSQSLSGLNAQLQMRYHGLQLPIITKELTLDDDQGHIDDQYSWSPMVNNKTFYPVRSGRLSLSMLRVIDSFGQVFDAFKTDTVGLKVSKTMLKSSAAMVRGAAAFEFTMSPRIIQPTRLKFDWVSAKNGSRVTDSDPGTSPVCGWFLYNKLDKNVSVFNSKGVELFVLQKDGKNIVRKAVPGTSAAEPTDNETLKKVVGFMEGSEAKFDSVKDQLIAIADKIQSKASSQQLTMALPIGLPVAVVTAQFSVELKDLPAVDQSWNAVATETRPQTLSYSVNIGNNLSKTDGLSGYFLNDKYDKFILPFNEKSKVPEEQFETQKLQQLTLLLDPRTEVTLSSGILPVATYSLPPHTLSRELKNINLRFLVTPVLTLKDQVKMPLMQRNDITWDFIQGQTTTPNISGDDDKGQLKFTPVEATEGWVKMNTFIQVRKSKKDTK